MFTVTKKVSIFQEALRAVEEQKNKIEEQLQHIHQEIEDLAPQEGKFRKARAEMKEQQRNIQVRTRYNKPLDSNSTKMHGLNGVLLFQRVKQKIESDFNTTMEDMKAIKERIEIVKAKLVAIFFGHARVQVSSRTDSAKKRCYLSPGWRVVT